MSTSSLRRQVKNIVHNYSEAEIKVREATSNDPWGPSSSLMSEIADLTYNVVAFSEIMSMVWKRLNDHGKNWRHVYKAMTLMEYLIKTGSERVAQQCRENIYAVQTLKDFQYIDRDGKDQGVNVREKAKQLVTLLKDEERLREERIHALKTKEKMAQTSSASSAPSAPGLGAGGLAVQTGPDGEQAWPQSSGEEDLQLQLALAMSKEEAEQPNSTPLEDAELTYAIALSQKLQEKEERLRRGDDLRLQMAIEESKREKAEPKESSLMELGAVDPWGAPAAPTTLGSAGHSPPPTAAPAPAPAAGPWGAADPWAAASPSSPPVDPWSGGPPKIEPPPDPWGDSGRANSDPWGSTRDQERRGSSAGDGSKGSTGSPVPFDLTSLGSTLPVRKTPESFLGPNASLVDLDSLVSSKPKPKQQPPPTLSNSSTNNPFLQTQGPSPVPGMAVTPGSTISSRGVSPTPPPTSNPFGSTSMASISPQPSSLGLSQLRTSPVPPNPMLGHMPPPSLGMVPPVMGMPGMGVPMVPPGMGMGMVQSSPMGMPFSGMSPMAPPGNAHFMGAGMPGQPPLILGGSAGVGGVMGAGGAVGGGGATGASTNPFLL
ncbi:epsin-1 isoform X3 [Sardina pilchardus]|uniref:epsin-1 isoform X3 n=1 Tax=Sardina pilchardus TaxID=27697 RepID=UPI002E151DC8